jgi:hypothetical protein
MMEEEIKMAVKYVFVTGGVVSGLGKGITAASLGRLLKARGYQVTMQKFDPYINIDPGTMNPIQHGEVFVTDDGTETDLDLGHYERFIDESLDKNSNVTTGKVYWSVLQKERHGDFGGGTVQVIPHITNEIKSRFYRAKSPEENKIAIIEVGGTVGDIESQPFLEAIRQFQLNVGHDNAILIHVTLIPYLGKDVSDCAALLEIIAGHDTKDSTSMKREDLQFSKELTGDIKGMKFGVPEEYLAEGLDPEVKASFMGVLDTLKELGAEVEFFSIKTMEYMIPAYYIIASAEASSNLERFDGVKYGFRAAEYEGLHDMYKKTRTAGFGEEVKRRIMLGSFVLSSGYYDAYYLKALRTKALIKKEFDQAFGKYDVLLAPASPFTAPKIGESLKDPLAMYLGDIYTVAVNLCGLPGITVPCGKDSKGLPIGIQMIGDCFMEKKILRAAHAYETSRGSFAVPGEGGTR